MNLNRFWPWKEFRRLEDELAHKNSEIRMHRDTICSLEQQLGDHVKLNAEKDKHLRKLGTILAMSKGIVVLFMMVCLCASGQVLTRNVNALDQNYFGLIAGTHTATITNGPSAVLAGSNTVVTVTTVGGVTNYTVNVDEVTLTNNAALLANGGFIVNAPHGFSTTPRILRVVMVNATAEGNYSIGDQVPIDNFYIQSTQRSPALICGANSTNYWVTTTATITVLFKDQSNVLTVTHANWTISVYAIP